jgi:hypothetical protein
MHQRSTTNDDLTGFAVKSDKTEGDPLDKQLVREEIAGRGVNEEKEALLDVEVNQHADEVALPRVRRSLARFAPIDSRLWKNRVASRLGLDSTLPPRGRPRKGANKSS